MRGLLVGDQLAAEGVVLAADLLEPHVHAFRRSPADVYESIGDAGDQLALLLGGLRHLLHGDVRHVPLLRVPGRIRLVRSVPLAGPSSPHQWAANQTRSRLAAITDPDRRIHPGRRPAGAAQGVAWAVPGAAPGRP